MLESEALGLEQGINGEPNGGLSFGMGISPNGSFSAPERVKVWLLGTPRSHRTQQQATPAPRRQPEPGMRKDERERKARRCSSMGYVERPTEDL
jgi:hypothetical protein